MTNWRERRLGARTRSANRRKDEPAEAGQPGPAPLIIAVALRQSARNHAEAALEALVALVQTASSEHVRVAAANAILDRALGKPVSGARAAEELASEAGGQAGPLDVTWPDDDE